MELINVLANFNSAKKEVRPEYILINDTVRKITMCKLESKSHLDRIFKCVYESDKEHIIELKYSPIESTWHLTREYK